MRVFLGCLLAAAMSVQIAQGLMCYTCDSPMPSSECNQQTNCSALSPKFAVCKTVSTSDEVGFPFTGKEIVVRHCAQTCIPTGEYWIGITKKVLCCNLDLCNRQGLNDTTTDNGGTGENGETGSYGCPGRNDATAPVSFLTTSISVLAVITYFAL